MLHMLPCGFYVQHLLQCHHHHHHQQSSHQSQYLLSLSDHHNPSRVSSRMCSLFHAMFARSHAHTRNTSSQNTTITHQLKLTLCCYCFSPAPSLSACSHGFPVHVALRDDVARVSPSDAPLIVDVIANDDLRGAAPNSVLLSIVSQPSVGSATVLPPEGPNGRPRLLYTQDAKSKIEPGSEVEVYYTVSVPGQPAPAPAVLLLLGAGE